MQSNKNKPEVSTPKRKVNDRSSTSSNDTSFESSKPVQKKQTVKNPQEKAPKGNEKNPTQTGENDKVQHRWFWFVFLNCSIIVNTQIKCIYIPHVQVNR
jgi:hypothetical protein